MLHGPDRAPARAMLRAIGFTDEDLERPIIGVANTWIETMPCNFNLRALAEQVKEGIRAAGGTPMEFNTIAISDGVTMGTEGMKASLVSREVIADSIELVGRGHMFDGVVALVGCDKTIPGGRDGAAPARRARASSSTAARSCPGDYAAATSRSRTSSRPSARTRPARSTTTSSRDIEDLACPGAGACGGQYTANTMATALEFLGLVADRHRRASRATDPRKDGVADGGGRARRCELLRSGHQAARRSCTREAFENAIAGVAATGGSTNAVLHLLAIAREAGVAARRSTTSTRICRAHADHRRPQARRPLRRGRSRHGRRHRPRRAAACSSAGSLHGDASRRRAHARARRPRRPSRRPGQEVIRPRGRIRSSRRRPRHPRGQPRARGLRGQARRPRAAPPTAGRRASSTREEDAMRGRSRTARSTPATWS